MTNLPIIGYKGGKGGGGGRTPKEAPDNLRSHAFVRFIDLICEGEIEGPASPGLTWIYLDRTPVENDDGTYNFEGFEVLTRPGTQGQKFMKGFPRVEKEASFSPTRITNDTARWAKNTTYALNAVRRPVNRSYGFEYKVTTAGKSGNTEPVWPTKIGSTVVDGGATWTCQYLGTDNAIEFSVTDADIDAVRLTISIPNLSLLNTKNGDLNGSSVEYAIDLKEDGGSFKPQPIQFRNEKVSGDVNATETQTKKGCYGFSGGISWEVGTYISNTPPSISYAIKYQLDGDVSWVTLKTGTLTMDDKGGPFGKGFQSHWPDYTGKQDKEGAFAVKDLEPGLYNVKVEKTSGIGTLTLFEFFNLVYKKTAIIKGKTTSKYEKSHRIELEGGGPYTLRVRRITPDSDSAALSNETWLDRYVEIIDAKLRYPNTALVAGTMDAINFSKIPQRGYYLKLLKIKIPSNYNPKTRVYTGSWDGEFKIAWSDNPAWCFYDLLSDDRYGLGKFIDEDWIDKWSLYEIGRYCDELVDDGFGGTEPRFTCNLYLQTREEAYKVIQDMASIFRGLAYWASGSITAVQDSPSDPVLLYSAANVVDGVFEYAGSSRKTRNSAVIVWWNDAKDFYKRKPEYVEDADAIDRYGYREAEITAFGCTSRGQAHRLGKWFLYTQSFEDRTVTFRTGLNGAVARPGQVVLVQDRDRAGARASGLVVSATTTTVVLDSAVTPVSGKVYTLYVLLPDGTLESKAVISFDGAEVTLESALSATPQTNAVWIISYSDLEPERYRVVYVTELEGGIYEINAVKHLTEKFDYVENNIRLVEPKTSLLTTRPDAVGGIVVTETLYETGTDVRNRVNVAWAAVSRGANYEVSYKVNDRNWTTLPLTPNSNVDIDNAPEGEYEFKIVTISATGLRSVTSFASKTIWGKTNPPGDVTNFTVTPLESGVGHFTWTLAEDLDVKIGGRVWIRYSTETNPLLVDWSKAVDIGPAVAGSATNVNLPLRDGTYLAKFVDSLGISSLNEVSIVVGVTNIVNMNVVETISQHLLWNGTNDGCFVNEDNGYLQISGSEFIDSMEGFIDEWGYIDSLGGVVIETEATHTFADIVDLGAVYPCRLSANIKVSGFYVDDFIDSRPGFLDDWGYVDGTGAAAVNAKLYVSTTNDNPAGSPVWGEWSPLFTGLYTFRAVRFKVVLTSTDVNQNISVQELEVTIDMPDRTQGQNALTSGAALYSVSYPNAFWVEPSVGIIANNLSTGDYYEITNSDETGFDITFKNSSGSAVSRVFGYVAAGFGYKN